MRADVSAQIGGNISRSGQHVVSVWATDDSPPEFQEFVYTIGNHQAGLPELVLIGDCDDLYVRIVNIIGKMQRDRGEALQHGEVIDFGAPLSALIVDAGRRGREEYAVQAGVFYGTDIFEVRQILLPDENGRYPGDPECLPPWCEQPVLTDIQ
jgi:hypothetical protein